MQLPQNIDAVTAALVRLPIPLPTPEEHIRGAGRTRWNQRHYEVRMHAPEEPEQLRRWFDEIEQAAPAVAATIQQDATGATVQIGIDGLLTHTLALQWLGRQPRAALLLTGFGSDLRLAREAASIGLPLCLGIDPRAPFASQVAELARLANLEVILDAYEGHEVASDDTAVAPPNGLATDLDRLGTAIGVYDAGDAADPGKRRTGDIAWETMRERSLFLIDGGEETPGNRCTIAAKYRVPCIRRDVRLDTDEDAGSIQLQIESAMTLVRTRGNVLVVGRAAPATIAALRHVLPSLRTGNIEMARLSTVVADRQSLSAP